jgi:hypothetical protein
MIKTNSTFKLANQYINIDYSSTNSIVAVSILEKDGKILFSGSLSELSSVSEAFHQIIKEQKQKE